MSRSACPRFGLRFRRPGPCDWRCGRPTADAPRRALRPCGESRERPRLVVENPDGGSRARTTSSQGQRPAPRWRGDGQRTPPVGRVGLGRVSDGLCCLVALRGGVRGRSCFFQSRSARRGVCGRPHGRRRGRGRPSLLSAGRPRGSSGLKPVVTLAGREPRSQSPRHISSSAWGRGGGWNLGGHFPSRNPEQRRTHVRLVLSPFLSRVLF